MKSDDMSMRIHRDKRYKKKARLDGFLVIFGKTDSAAPNSIVMRQLRIIVRQLFSRLDAPAAMPAIRKPAIMLSLLFIFSTLPLPALSSDLTIMTGEWKPYVSAELKNYGFIAEIVSSAFRSAGIESRFEIAPWPRCEAEIKYGKRFAAVPYSMNRVRSEFAYFSNPIANSRTVFFYNKKKIEQFDFSGFNSLRPFLIGGVRGYYYHEVFSGKNLLVDYSEDEKEVLKKLIYRRIDLVPMNQLVGWVLIRESFPEAKGYLASTDTALDEENLRLMVSKAYPGSRGLLAKFNKGLDAVRHNGTYARIMNRYQIPESVGILK